MLSCRVCAVAETFEIPFDTLNGSKSVLVIPATFEPEKEVRVAGCLRVSPLGLLQHRTRRECGACAGPFPPLRLHGLRVRAASRVIAAAVRANVQMRVFTASAGRSHASSSVYSTR